jgi:hypothetical protein
MKSFKGYLKEAPAWTQSLSTMLFDLPRAELADVKIPLSPSIFSRVWPKPVRSKVFHLTDFDGVKKLKKMQGKKRSVSAFYNIDPYIISSGIKSEGGYVVEMDGDVLVAAPDDISSQPDKTGRRWLSWSTLIREMGGGSKLKKMEKDIENLLVEILIKNDMGPYKKKLTPYELNKGWSYLGKSVGGKEKSIIIKDYIDGMEKIMKKHSKQLRSLFTDYVDNRELTPDPDSGEFELWDEIVVNNFKIKKIHIGPEFGPDFEDEDDIDGFPFELYQDVGDMADYVTRTSQKGK